MITQMRTLNVLIVTCMSTGYASLMARAIFILSLAFDAQYNYAGQFHYF